MSDRKTGNIILKTLLKPPLGRAAKTPIKAENWRKVLIVRQHNQFGDMLASVSLFRAIKEKFPECEITLIAGPENYYAVEKNQFIDRLILFEKKRIFHPVYQKEFLKTLREKYDAAIVPATVSLSSTSNLIAGFANADLKISAASLNGKENQLAFLFDYRIELNWDEHSDRHVSDFIQDIIAPLGIHTDNLKSQITFDETDKSVANDFIEKNELRKREIIAGLHVGAGKIPNRWDAKNFADVIRFLKKEYNAGIFITGSDADKEVIASLSGLLKETPPLFMNRTIPQLAAMIDEADLFIANDTGVMHVAAALSVPQISIFGPTNPANWGAVGKNKINLKNNDDINSVTTDEVIEQIKSILQ